MRAPREARVGCAEVWRHLLAPAVSRGRRTLVPFAPCRHCCAREVRNRCRPEDLPAELFACFQNNDQATAWAHAFDRRLLDRAGVRVDVEVLTRIDRPCFPPRGISLAVQLRCDHPCGVRLDRLVSGELATSRSQLDQLVGRGLVRVIPDDSRAWRRPARAGQRLEIAAEALPGDRGG